MRVYILMTLIFGLAVYSWRNWYVSLCGLIVLEAVMKHPDMPRMVLGIQGANPWNLLFVAVLLPWIIGKLSRSQPGGVPLWLSSLVIAYLCVIVVAFVRGFLDVESIHTSEGGMIACTSLVFFSDHFLNPLKYSLVAILLFDGARTRRLLIYGLIAVLAQATLYAAQVVKHVPLGVLFLSGEWQYRHRIARECGLHANNMALVLVMAFWGMVWLVPLLRRQHLLWRAAAGGAALVILLATALCNSRAGFLAFAGVGLVCGLVRWRGLLVVAPLLAIVLCLMFPSIPERMGVGFGTYDASGEEVEDWDAISAGRLTNLWPPTIEEIGEAPLLGQGRLTILRTSLFDRIAEREGRCPTHPHNAYLEMLLDSGLVGLLVTLAVFIGVPWICWRGTPTDDPLISAAVGFGLAGAGTLLIMSISGQSFFPREGINMVLCAYALMLRAHTACRYLRPTDYAIALTGRDAA